MTPEQYLQINDLWDLERLKKHAQETFVYVIESVRFPGLVMLHYVDACQYNNIWTPFARLSRGLILDMKNQKVIAYPFDKFFNLGQVAETKYTVLQDLKEFEVSEKLDGSMIIMFKDPNTNKLTLTTKGSFDSEHGVYANALPFSSQFLVNAERYTNRGTLVFELIAKPFQIVVDYRIKGYKEGLYLIGYRDHITGKLATFNEVAKIAGMLGVSTFKTYSFDSLDKLIATVKDLPVLEEGFVLRYPNDLMVKVKGEAYLAAHRFISHLSDRHILEAVGEGTAAALAELAPEEYKQDVLDKIVLFEKRVAEINDICYTLYSGAPKDGPRKDFALWVIGNAPPHLKGFLFQLMDHKALDKKHVCRVIEEIDNVDGKTRI
jgi:RNA ligase